MVQTLVSELHATTRGLLRRPRVVIPAILTLAIGVGGITAVFSMVDAVLLRPSSFPDAARLVHVWQTFPAWRDQDALRNNWDRGIVSYAEYLDLRARRDVFENAAIVKLAPAILAGAAEAERITMGFTTPTLLETLGIRPTMGRGFLEEDDRPERDRVVMLGHGLWMRRFGGDPTVVGRHVRCNDQIYTVIGVLPAGFHLARPAAVGTFEQADAWTLIAAPAPHRRARNYETIARLVPGVSYERAGAAAESALADASDPTERGARVEGLTERETGPVRRPLGLLLAAAALLLIVAGGNVANLILSDWVPRTCDMAVRVALGAGRWHLVRLAVGESLMLAVPGGVLGIVLGSWGVDGLIALAPPSLPGLDQVSINPRVLAMAVGAAAATTILFALLPALAVVRADLTSSLRQGVRHTSGARVQSVVAAGQIALAVVTVVVAALLVQSLARLEAVQPGFQVEGLLTFRASLPDYRYRTSGERVAFFARVREKLSGLPGVTSVGQTSVLPFRSNSFESEPILIEGRHDQDDWTKVEVQRRYVSPGYFQTLRIPVLEGTLFDEVDASSGACPMVVSLSLARRFWPANRGLGASVRFRRDTCRVVAVVGDVRDTHASIAPTPVFYVPMTLQSSGRADFVVLTAQPPAATAALVRQAVRDLDPELPLTDLATMEEVSSETLKPERFRALVLGLLGCATFVLAGIGAYGVLAFLTASRAREIAVRATLGASPRGLLWLVLRHALGVAVAGSAIGVGVAMAASRLLRGLLFGVTALDALTYVTAALVLILSGLLAGWLPGRRAMRIDPARALKAE